MAFCNQCGAKLADGAKFCSNCGAAADPTDTVERETARRDPTMSPPPASVISAPSRGGVGLILPAMVLLAILVIGYLLFTGRNADRATPDATVATTAGTDTAGSAPITGTRRAVDQASDAATVASGETTRASTFASATVLDSAFHSDPDGAALRYPGAVRVSGVIASMVQPGPTPSLSMEGRTRFNFIVVNFPAGYGVRLAPLMKGQAIDVACDRARDFAGTTILSGCLLI